MEEEGGFGVYGEKTRYATLQKQKHDNSGSNNRGYETLRHFRSNIPSLVRMQRGLLNHRSSPFEQVINIYYDRKYSQTRL